MTQKQRRHYECARAGRVYAAGAVRNTYLARLYAMFNFSGATMLRRYGVFYPGGDFWN